MGTKDHVKPRRAKRTFTPLTMTYTQIFHQLRVKGAISPIGPLVGPPKEKRNAIRGKDAY